MIIVDAQLSPHLALWIDKEFGHESFSASHLGLLHASDRDIFDFGRQKNAIILTKDSGATSTKNPYKPLRYTGVLKTAM